MIKLKAYKTSSCNTFDYDRAYARLEKACKPYMDLISQYWVEDDTYWVDLKKGVTFTEMEFLHEETITDIKSILKGLAEEYRQL